MADQTAWHVTDQAQTSWQEAGGRIVRGWEVTFALANGTTGSVRVPLDDYTAPKVRQLIDAYAAEIAAVHQLGTP